eukprot:CAMPEP_0181233940 /NCGR_PEP_ID=MMETSP1096-20121128/36647_1 /TAXON_ID=156174 ORGANISM="Chrysochromulina ericina, Strain CCMP281" /NCGR_SAMPLE_ID=MMETSP1096 /ASSEMBLY_ACC=CAM_ASM_000453 /LENGTH=31 /DNA_ID= /DNA_START= /DNA_END= /DNA_ORIENTATION=
MIDACACVHRCVQLGFHTTSDITIVQITGTT